MLKLILLRLRGLFIRGRGLNATRVVALSFALIILAGALLLTLPIASRDGESAGFFTGLFTAFHHAFFPGKTNWVFDWRTDEIILILPEIFWAKTGALVLALCLGGLWLTALAAWRLHRRHAD